MSDMPATFRELKGIGPASEARLHEAGVLSWAGLAEVLAVLNQVQGRGSGTSTVRELAALAAARAGQVGDGDAPHLPAGERSEAFVVRIALDSGDGHPMRSSLTHVRTQNEHEWAGWAPGEVVAAIEDEAGAAAVEAEAAAPAASSENPRPTRRRPAAARPGENGMPEPEQILVLDAGKVIGGTPRDIELHVPDTRSVGTLFSYRATLVSHTMGTSEWVTWGRQEGTAEPPSGLPLRFEQVELTPGVHQLQVQLAIRTAAPLGRAPALVLAGEDTASG